MDTSVAVYGGWQCTMRCVQVSRRETAHTGDNSDNLTPVYIILLLIFLILLLESWCSQQEFQNDELSQKIAQSVLYSVVYEGRIRRLIENVRTVGYANVSSTPRRRCPSVPRMLLKRDTSVNDSLSVSLEDVALQHLDLKPGGTWTPHNCVARHNVAVVIPYRNRKEHLPITLSKLIPVLKSQEIAFGIYLSEQNGSETFNKGILMNAAYREALMDRPWDCFVFHDVDLIPEDIRTMYTCPRTPRHLSVAIDEYQYILPYDFLVGGVFILRTEHFLRVNGYSNRYWGWGSEDDDMSQRLKHAGFRIDRPPYNVARFKQIKHEKREPAEWKIRYKQLYNAGLRQHTDGVSDVKYTLISRKHRRLFTNLLIDVGLPPH